MFLLSISIVPGSARMIWSPKGQRVPGRPRLRSTLTHLPTGRRWEFNSRKAGMAAQRTMAAMVAEGRLSILPVAPLDAEATEGAAAA